MKIAVNDLRPNPFRHLGRYPINPEKVAALVQSIKDTSFWDNLLARKAPNGGGGFEIAYGHHRLQALKKSHIDEIDVPVRKLTDTDMARIMAHENMEEWGHNALVEQETVRSIIEAYGKGQIELPMRGAKDGRGASLVRYAPSFIQPRGGIKTDKPYTAATLATFLGWNVHKVEGVLAALGLIEEELASEEHFQGLTTRQAEAVASETRRVAKETGKTDLARAVGKKLAAGMRKSVRGRDRAGKERDVQDVTIHNARRRANEMMGSQHRKDTPKKTPPIEKFSEQLCHSIGAAFPTDSMQAKLDAILKYRDELPAGSRVALARALRNLAARATKLADKLEG